VLKPFLKEAQTIQDECLVNKNQTMRMESIDEDDVASNDEEEQEVESTSQKTEQLEEPQEEEEISQEMKDKPKEKPEQPQGEGNKEEAKVPSEQESSDEESSEATIHLVCEVDPKEWHQIHDEWLHAAMRAAMGDTMLTTIPNIENVERMERKPPASNLNLQPT